MIILNKNADFEGVKDFKEMEERVGRLSIQWTEVSSCSKKNLSGLIDADRFDEVSLNPLFP